LSEMALVIRIFDQDLGDDPGPLIEGEPSFTPPGCEDEVLEAADERAAQRTKTARLVKRMEDNAASIRSSLGQSGLDEQRGLGTLIPLMRGRQIDKSLDRLQTYLKRFIAYLGSDRDPKAIAKVDVVGWRDEMVKKGLTGTNQAQHLAKVGAAFAQAVSKGIINSNPFAGVKPEYTLEEKKVSRKKRAFTAEELGALAIASQSMAGSFPTIIKCLALTGARSGEICGLRVKDVHAVDGVLCFDITDEVAGKKNASSVRVVPVPSALKEVILSLCAGRGGEAPLFQDLPKRRQGPAHKLQIDSSKLIKANVINDRRVTLHCLRHTWRQRAGHLKIDEAVRRAILGHVKGNDDHDLTYGSRPRPDELAKAIELVAESLLRDFRDTVREA
jgi:integrase